MLAEAGITDPQSFFSSTLFTRHHDVALNAVLNGSVDAAGIEVRELEALHQNRFIVSASEEALGYPKNLKTLTNHFRGICYRALSISDWQVGSAVRMLAGRDAADEVGERVNLTDMIFWRAEDLPPIIEGALDELQMY